jgi:hypothetical protein
VNGGECSLSYCARTGMAASAREARRSVESIPRSEEKV